MISLEVVWGYVRKFNQALRQVPTLGASARDLHLINTFLGSVEQKNFHN